MQNKTSEDKISKIEVAVTDGILRVDLSKSGLSLKTLTQRTNDILPILYALLSADDAWLGLTDEEFEVKGRACMAIDLLCQHEIHSVTERAKLLEDIANGDAQIADHGFPEFSGAHIRDV